MRRFVAIALSTTLMLQMVPLLAAPDTRARRGQTAVTTGVITGTTRDSAGQLLPKHVVQLRNLKTGELAATTTSDGFGAFSFADLPPASYVLEVVNPAGAIIGISAPIAVASGATVAVTVSATTVAAIAGAAAAGGGVSTALIITTIAAAAGIAGVVVAVRRNASPSQ
jgi:hypothetical protein